MLRDGRERAPAAPVETVACLRHRDLVGTAIPLPDEMGPGLETATRGLCNRFRIGNTFQGLARWGGQSSMPTALRFICQRLLHEGHREIRCRRRSEDILPTRLGAVSLRVWLTGHWRPAPDQSSVSCSPALP